MSQDGSSSKSYIKHPTEKARLEGLAFTSFPEDYLPYTSPTYQRKAPYLIWDQQQPYDGVLRSSRGEQLRRYCCSTSALVAAVVLLIAAILAIVAVSVYLGVITNLFRSPIFSISARLRVLEGDDFNYVLLNQTSDEFSAKAEYYRTLVESLLLSSSLQPAYVAARIYAFRQGSLLVFFRVHLDRRKLVHDDKEVLLIVKSLLMEQAMSSPSSSFDNLILDLPSIDVREYGEEEWFDSDDDVPWEEADSLTQNKSIHSITFSPSSSTDAPIDKSADSGHVNTHDKAITSTSQSSTPSSTPKESPYTKPVLLTVRKTEAPRIIHLKNSSAVRRTTVPPATSTGQGVVHYGYAEWRPIDLPQAIQVATLGDFRGPKKEQKSQHGTGVVRPVTMDDSVFKMGSVQSAGIPNVAPTIMSSVSLVIRPSSKNRSSNAFKDPGNLNSGLVRAVALERIPDRALPVADLERKARIDDVPFALLDESENKRTKLNSGIPESEISEKSGLTLSHEVGSNSSSDQTKNATAMLEAEVVKTINLSYQTTDPPLHSTFPTTEELSRTFLDMHVTEGLLDVLEDDRSQIGILPEELNKNSSHNLPVPNEELSVSTDADRELETSEAATDMGSTEAHDDKSKLQEDASTTGIPSKPPEFHSFSELETTALDISLPPSSTTDSEGTKTEFVSTEFPDEDSFLTEVSSQTEYSLIDAHLHSLQKSSRHDQVDHDSQDAVTADQSSKNPLESSSEANLPDASPTADISNTSGINITFLEDLQRFRKIVQPFSHISPNDINSGDDLKHPIFSFNNKFPSTLPTVPATSSDDHTESDEESKTSNSSSTSVTESGNEQENQSSIVGFGKNPIFSSHRCTEDEMFCGSGECVPTNYRCNMRRDCRDNSDEQNCTCSEYLAVVGQSQKICDGIKDCWDSSDESECSWCLPGQFLCPQAKFCINMSQVCDGSNDCPFGTDERYCVKLAQDEATASSADYHSEGYLMVRKNGKWGKLCLDTLHEAARSDTMKLEELGRAVCSALTYRELEKATKVQDVIDDKSSYYEIKSHPLQQSQHRSAAIFRPSACKSQDVVHVKCNSLECGLRPMAISSSRRRIVGGQSTGSGSWPWQVALYKEGDFQCGAVLISDSWLLSAGHCFYSTQSAYWTARLGILRRGTELPSPVEKVRRIRKIILHPEYIDKGFINDIALLLLDEPVPFSDYLRPLCLPTPTEDVRLWHGQHCSVVGWGKLFEIGHTFPDSLQEVRLPVISTEECRKRIVFLSMYHITDNMFCAGFERGGRDACLGDSGGPLMCQRQDGRWVLLGITSNGDGCGRPGRPGVYTKVTQYLKWIDQTMSSHIQYPNSSAACLGRRCSLGRCVQSYKICDGRFDCVDGSDEASCPVSPV